MKCTQTKCFHNGRCCLGLLRLCSMVSKTVGTPSHCNKTYWEVYPRKYHYPAVQCWALWIGLVYRAVKCLHCFSSILNEGVGCGVWQQVLYTIVETMQGYVHLFARSRTHIPVILAVFLIWTKTKNVLLYFAYIMAPRFLRCFFWCTARKIEPWVRFTWWNYIEAWVIYPTDRCCDIILRIICCFIS